MSPPDSYCLRAATPRGEDWSETFAHYLPTRAVQTADSHVLYAAPPGKDASAPSEAGVGDAHRSVDPERWLPSRTITDAQDASDRRGHPLHASPIVVTKLASCTSRWTPTLTRELV